MDRLTIIKVGGKVLEDDVALDQFLHEFNKISGTKILVHGGGRTATRIAGELGVETKIVEGRRITDKNMLEVVTMVYAGLINKKVVAGLQSLGCNAIGLTGADMDMIRAKKRIVSDINYGYVGDIEEIRTKELRMLLNENVIPVIASLTHDGEGQILNTNADTITSELAAKLADYYNINLVYCFEKKGVLSDPEDENSIIYELSFQDFLNYQKDNIIKGGMIPKLENGFNAKRSGVREVIITNVQNLSSGKGTRLILNVQ